MAFNYFKTDTDPVVMGSGELYAAPYNKDKLVDAMTLDEMECIGYIKENATITTEYERNEVTSANRGVVANFGSVSKVEFSTGIISFNLENVSKFLTGTYTDGKYYFEDSAVSPQLCLKFVSTDETAGKQIVINMYRTQWTGNLELDFNTEDPIEFDYTFTLLTNKTGSGKSGYFSIEEKDLTQTQTEESTN